MGKIFYIMGKSSSGKDTIYKKLSERMPELQRIVPYTTRPIRDGEQEGVEYHFVGEDRLREMQEAGRVIEVRAYNTKCGVWTYFTADDGQIDLEKKDYLVIGTLESFQALKKYFGEEKIVPIYIEVDDGVRLSRALEREQREKEPRYEEMCRRFLADSADFSEGNLRRSGIRKRFVNMELERCLEEIGAYIKDFRV
ncbi:MAG: guanylate kinase [Mediterraneibacter sp.]